MSVRFKLPPSGAAGAATSFFFVLYSLFVFSIQAAKCFSGAELFILYRSVPFEVVVHTVSMEWGAGRRRRV